MLKLFRKLIMKHSYQYYNEMCEAQKQKAITEMYIDDKLSFADIAKKLHTYANKIRRDAIKFKIKIRDKSEAQTNALTSGKHTHPTKGKKRSEDTKSKIGNAVMKAWNELSDAELNKRKENSREKWQNLDEDTKTNILRMANKAVRVSSKEGSKLEKYLLNELLAHGFMVEFHKEQTLSNTKLQIDLFLPTINLAIEVDGPSHFEPVWGDDSLKRNKKYDSKKEGLIIGRGWNLIRIKQVKDFSKSRAKVIFEQLLDQIKNLSKNTVNTITIEDK